jgi:uncharacterized membrane protein YcfT
MQPVLSSFVPVLTMSTSENASRVAWVDYAKGICIILVILMHANGGVEKLTGQLTSIDAFIQWAKPFRMPDFFLISGLFLASRINATWPKFLDAKLFHFGYFYVLWAVIQHLYKDLTRGGAEHDSLSHYLTFLIEPTSTLWFIYMLAVFFVVAKITLPLPKLVVFGVAALLEMLPVATSSIIIDEFCGRFVYFYAGYWFASYVFTFADRVAATNVRDLLPLIGIWAASNALLVASGVAALPGFSLVLGFIGTAALIAVSVLCARSGWFGLLRYCGQNSIVIYLAFTLFMGPVRIILFKLAPGMEPAITSLLSALAGVAGPLVLHWLTKGSWLDFLFARPGWARLKPAQEAVASNSYIQFNPERRLSPR